MLFRSDGTLFGEGVKTRIKEALLRDCNLHTIVRLPNGVFAPYTGIKTNLLFFTKGKPTEKIWYYDLSDIKVGKKTPLTAEKFEDFFRLLPSRGDSERSWTVTREQINAKNYDLKAVNPNAKVEEDTRTPEEILDLIEKKGQEIQQAITQLRAIKL